MKGIRLFLRRTVRWAGGEQHEPSDLESAPALKIHPKCFVMPFYKFKATRFAQIKQQYATTPLLHFARETAKEGACQGDSGGPFVREIRKGRQMRWLVIGIVSWGEGCAQRDKYENYTREYPFLDWINRTIEGFKYKIV